MCLSQSFGVGAAAVGTTLSTYALARLMMNIPSGIIGDTRGRKPLMVWGPAITALGEWSASHAWAIYLQRWLGVSLWRRGHNRWLHDTRYWRKTQLWSLCALSECSRTLVTPSKPSTQFAEPLAGKLLLSIGLWAAFTVDCRSQA